jgi:hypothetical protein
LPPPRVCRNLLQFQRVNKCFKTTHGLLFWGHIFGVSQHPLHGQITVTGDKNCYGVGCGGIFRRSCYPDISLDTKVIQKDYQSVRSVTWPRQKAVYCRTQTQERFLLQKLCDSTHNTAERLITAPQVRRSKSGFSPPGLVSNPGDHVRYVHKMEQVVPPAPAEFLQSDLLIIIPPLLNTYLPSWGCHVWSWNGCFSQTGNVCYAPLHYTDSYVHTATSDTKHSTTYKL